MEHQLSTVAVRAIARAEMDQWGLTEAGWTFVIDPDPKRRLGQCRYREKEVALSLLRIQHDSAEDVVNTIRHEIAHAIHYERRGDELFERRWTGRKWVRKIAPHGREWKAIAREVGMTTEPKATTKTNISKNLGYKWNLVLVRNGEVECLSSGYHRAPSVDFSQRYIRGRKRETMGNIYFISGSQYEQFMLGTLCPTRITFYQKSGRPVNPLRIAA